MNRPVPTCIPEGLTLQDLCPLLGQPGVYAGVVKVTPALAATWAQDPNRPPNRTISTNRVRVIRGWMRRGEFVTTHQGYGFDEEGRAFDGLHRMTAQAEEGVTLKILVTAGLPYKEVMPATDEVRKRNLGQNLAIRGERNAKVLATAVRWTYLALLGPAAVRAEGSPSQYEGFQLLKVFPTLRDVVNRCCADRALRDVTGSLGVVSALFFLFLLTDPSKGQLFMDAVSSGAGMGMNDSRLRLRNKLTKHRHFKSVREGRLTQVQTYNYMVVAWNAFHEGRTLRKIQAPKGGNVPEIRRLDRKGLLKLYEVG